MAGTEERISRGCRAFPSGHWTYIVRTVRTMYVYCTSSARWFNAVTSIGIKSKGVCTALCTTVFWAIIMPIVTYGSELWVLHSDEVKLLRKFQRYIGRRCQRFPKKSPNYLAFYPLGWISIDCFIKVKKLLLLRTIMVMAEDAICKRILIHRAHEYGVNSVKCSRNECDSPIYETFNKCKEFGILEKCIEMVDRGCYLSKQDWKKLVWDTAWPMEYK